MGLGVVGICSMVRGVTSMGLRVAGSLGGRVAAMDRVGVTCERQGSGGFRSE